jgi:hypothetical protein
MCAAAQLLERKPQAGPELEADSTSADKGADGKRNDLGPEPRLSVGLPERRAIRAIREAERSRAAEAVRDGEIFRRDRELERDRGFRSSSRGEREGRQSHRVCQNGSESPARRAGRTAASLNSWRISSPVKLTSSSGENSPACG